MGTSRVVPTVLFALIWLVLDEPIASAQAVENSGFKAMPRPINYSLPLAPAGGAKAVIVFGKDAAYTKACAQAVQKSIEDWCGLKLEVLDDRTVTGEDTWLLKDEYRKTPMILLGNAWDNRLMHAIATRYLLQSNRTWPGGDRYVIRSLLEPLEADVNYLTLEASTQAGLEGAVAKLAELVKTREFANSPASIPRIRVVSAAKDKWVTEPFYWWKAPPEMTSDLHRSVTDLAKAYKGPTVTAGDNFAKVGLGNEIHYYTMGGIYERPQPTTVPEDEGYHRASAAMWLLGYRAIGGRTHVPSDHYGAMNSIIGARCFMQSGLLSEEEFNELESAFVLSAAHPNEDIYDHIGNYTGYMNNWGNRHWVAGLLLLLHTQDYVLHHCRIDDRARKEIQRRYDNARKTASEYVRSFRHNLDVSDLGEDTLLQLYILAHQGMMDMVPNGSVRRMADRYMMSQDNLYVPGTWPYYGCYVGLWGFSNGPGSLMSPEIGRGLLDAASFYYDDPEYRWLAKNWSGVKWTVATPLINIYMDYEGPLVKPTRYNGVRSLPYDERMYRVICELNRQAKVEEACRLAPKQFDKAIDRVAFRDGLDPDDAYLFLASAQDVSPAYAAQNNSIGRYTDLSELWLFAHMAGGSTWSRNVVSVSNGKSFVPRVACQQDALMNLGEVSAVSSREPDIAGSDWTRTILHWKGHYFVVMDRMKAIQEDEFSYVCRWRSINPASLDKGVWTARSNTGNTMRIQNTDSLFQTSEHWAVDGAADPYVLQQYKQARLNAGETQTYQNLIYVSGAKRPDEFETRRAGETAMIVRGRTAGGDHLALVGTAGGQFPLAEFETDAEIYYLSGDLLHLAGVRSVKVNTNGESQEIFWSQRPANLLVNCQTGQGELEITGDGAMQVKTGSSWASLMPCRKTVTLATAGSLPRAAATLEALWNKCRPPSSNVQPPAGGEQVFDVVTSAQVLRCPLRKLTKFDVTSTPAWDPPHAAKYIWPDTSKLEVTITLPQSTQVECMRLITITKQVPMYGVGSEGYGAPHYKGDDFSFSLVLSDDGFQKDIRKIDKPTVVYEETSECYVGHFTKFRLPTWRVTVGAKAKQVKLLPRATTKERATLQIKDIEAYEARRVDELTAQAQATDIDGDGANELVLGTRECELAAYDSSGKRLWLKDTFPGAIHKLAVGDLEDDGKVETLAYLSTERLHRINGDGSERPVADITAAQLKYCQQRCGGGNITTIGVWGRGDPKNKEVVAWAEGMFRIKSDGTTFLELNKMPHPAGSGLLRNIYPNEPEVLATVYRYTLFLYSSRMDDKGNYVQLGYKNMVGPDSGESLGLDFVRGVNVPGFKGVLTAIEGEVACFPISSFLPTSAGSGQAKEDGWRFSTGGVPAVAALLEDFDGDGTPEVLLGRRDGFVNVFKLADGSLLALPGTGQPIVGIAMLKGTNGKPVLAVGTKFGVHLFVPDSSKAGFKRLGSQSMAVAAFAGPGGKARDRVYIVDASGKVSVLVVK